MAAKGVLYGAIAVLLAASLVASSFAFVYYSQSQQQASEAQGYIGELDTAIARYNSLSSSYQTALTGYNSTISLLSQSLSNLNTSSPAYQKGSLALASLWRTYLNLTKARIGSTTYSVNILLEFGNGTRRWYNDTAVQPGWNAYVVTLVALNGDVQASWYPNYGEHFVNGIGGIENVPSNNEGWLLWTRNSTNVWRLSSVGPDLVPMFNGSIFAWTYCHYNPSTYAPLCSP